MLVPKKRPVFLVRPCTALLIAFFLVIPAGAADRNDGGWTGLTENVATAGRLRHALLVGVTDYPDLDARWQLQGPANDVELLRQVLIERFGFDADRDDLVMLSARQSERERPTRANIQREFLRLGRVVQQDDDVIILLAGHGSHQPDNDPENPNDIEPDGLDEIFLPQDVRGWNGETRTVENAIVDDELRTWIGAMVERGAHVCLILDACTSASGIRGSDDERARMLPVAELIPDLAALMQPALDTATSLATSLATRSATRSAASVGVGGAARTASSRDELPLFRDDTAGSVVAIYAAQSNESTPERLLPQMGDDRRYHGLLTWTISEILLQSRRPLTYAELVRAVHGRYAALGRRSPTPLVEGPARDHTVLRQSASESRPGIRLFRERDDWIINAGSLHGMTVGTILAVHDPIDGAAPDAETDISADGRTTGNSNNDKRPMGHVEVHHLTPSRSTVIPVRYGIHRAVEKLPNPGRAEIVHQQPGRLSLRVTVDHHAPDGSTVSPTHRSEFQNRLRSAAETVQLVTIVDDQPDWLVRMDGDHIRLTPASGVSPDERANHEDHLPPIVDSDQAAAQCVALLERIARATNLLKLTLDGDTERTDLATGLTLRMVDADGAAITESPHGFELVDGQRITLQIENTGCRRLDVTLLYVDSGYGITDVFPQAGELNRLEPGDRLPLPIEVTSDTTGVEHVIAIAVPGHGELVDFGFLAQSSLAEARRMSARRGASADGFESPLGQLCRAAMFGGSVLRGTESNVIDEHLIRRLTWRVSATKSRDSHDD